MNYPRVAGIFLLAFLFSCSTTKKSTKNNITVNEPAITLDTIQVVADSEPEKKVYRASKTLSTDIIHTKVEVSFDWKKAQMNGKATIAAKPYFYPSDRVYLDARGMEIKSVNMVREILEKPSKGGSKLAADNTYIEKNPLKYKYENDSLKIDLGKEYTTRDSYKIEIEYISKPNEVKKGGSAAISSDKGLYFINPDGKDPDKMPQIWTQGETQATSVWCPTVDSPNEKMTSEVLMTVDDKYTTLSNGSLISSKKNADGTRTDHWKMDLPHSAYLFMMTVGEFKKVTDTPWNGKEISYYVEKEYEQHAKAIFGNTKEMIEFYSKKLGVDYPWQKYAQIVVRDYVSGAMENTSATLHGDFMVYQTTRETIDGIKGEDVIAHELFHQWFGDLVTAESWSNLPLNESFATYGEYLWEEYKYGRDAADEHHAQSRFGYLAQAHQKQVHMIRYDYNNKEDMFDAFSYNKGGQILHMLRKYVGDEAFFASLKTYLESNKFKPAEIHHLRLAFEETTGEDLNWFFNEWFFNKEHPVLDVTKSYNEADKSIVLNVKQRQDFSAAPLYKLPLYVDIYSGGKKDRKRIWIEDANQTFTFTGYAKPDLVNFDAERQLLADIKYLKTKEEYIFQYKNAPLWGDRDEALEYFKGNISDKEIYDLVKWAAQNDKWKTFRSDAVSFLGETAKEKEAELKPLLMNIAVNDVHTKVRAEAIRVLSSSYSGAELDALYEKALNEQSYAVVSEALSAVAKTNSVVAMQKAKTLENESSKKIIYAVADLYTRFGSDEHHDFFARIRNQFSGYELMAYGAIYGKYLKRISKPETALKAADELDKMAKSDNQYVRYTAMKVYKTSLLDYWGEKEDNLKGKSGKEEELKTVSETKNKLSEKYKTLGKN